MDLVIHRQLTPLARPAARKWIMKNVGSSVHITHQNQFGSIYIVEPTDHDTLEDCRGYVARFGCVGDIVIEPDGRTYVVQGWGAA